MDKLFENNQVTISGTISREAEFSHEVFGEGFYMTYVKVPRTSGYEDEIPVTISDRMCNVKGLRVGQQIAVCGQFRSFNYHKDGRNKVVLSVFAHEMDCFDEPSKYPDANGIFLDGYICKEPTYRQTPRGRDIADLLVAVNRAYGKSDYIPCIAWGRNARYVPDLEVGSRVKICGRIQSREYSKRISDTETETRVAYEVSVSKIELVEEE